MSKKKLLIYFLLFLSVLMASIAGSLDLQDKEELKVGELRMSKMHLWKDAIYILVLILVIKKLF